MLKAMKLPRGVVNVLSIGLTSEIEVDERYSHRPDHILEDIGIPSMSHELFNNSISNTSPISMEKGDDYIVANHMCKNYFGAL